MTLIVAAVIVHDNATNRVVLLQRSQNAKFAQGMWDLPAGKSEPGEPVTETAVRELYEETSLTVKPESLKVAHIVHGAWGVEAPNGFLTVVFAAHEWTGEPETANPASTRRFVGSIPTPSPRYSWTHRTQLPTPSAAVSIAGLRCHLMDGNSEARVPTNQRAGRFGPGSARGLDAVARSASG